jgi:hypothetical protein
MPISGDRGAVRWSTGVAVDANGNPYVADTYNDRIARSVSGQVTTIAVPDARVTQTVKEGMHFDTLRSRCLPDGTRLSLIPATTKYAR